MNIRCLFGHKWKPVYRWRWSWRRVFYVVWGAGNVSEGWLDGDWLSSHYKCTRCGARRN